MLKLKVLTLASRVQMGRLYFYLPYLVILCLLAFFSVNMSIFQLSSSFLHDKRAKEGVVAPTGSEFELSKDILDFEGFNNDKLNESSPMIVPNIIHIIYMNKTELRFHEMVCIFSIFLNQKPDTILIHCENCSFHGVYWEKIEKVKALRKLIRFNQIPVRRSIFGLQGSYSTSHRGDYWRILMLMQYGGIYLDNDVYVVSSLDKYRRFEMTVGFENMNEWVMGSQVLLAHKNARFLKAWFDTYRSDYKKDEWYTNAGHMPGKIVKKDPFIAHIEAFRLGVFIGTGWLYREIKTEWKTMVDTWHVLINHRHYLDADNYKIYPEFDENNVWVHNCTFTHMCRDVLTRIKPFQ